ncbi:MAG: hypothetical protein U0325_36890, partial [Polyangiales bacterium]
MSSHRSSWQGPRAFALAAAILASACSDNVVRFGGNADAGPASDVVEGEASACGGTQALCRGNCVDLASDANNCGRCGNACGAGNVCISGLCTVDCAEGQTRCGAACVDLMTAQSNCGACGAACPGGTVCSGGACQVECAEPYIACTVSEAPVVRDAGVDSGARDVPGVDVPAVDAGPRDAATDLGA